MKTQTITRGARVNNFHTACWKRIQLVSAAIGSHRDVRCYDNLGQTQSIIVEVGTKYGNDADNHTLCQITPKHIVQ